MQKYLRKADKEYEETWVLKCDISKFFFNIDCEILYKIIERKIKDREFLAKKLHLKLNQKTAYFKASQGVNFCGYCIWKTHKLLRVQSKKKMRRKLKNFEKLYRENRIDLDYVLACINSWRGYANHCNSFNLQCEFFDEFVLKK